MQNEKEKQEPLLLTEDELKILVASMYWYHRRLEEFYSFTMRKDSRNRFNKPFTNKQSDEAKRSVSEAKPLLERIRRERDLRSNRSGIEQTKKKD